MFETPDLLVTLPCRRINSDNESHQNSALGWKQYSILGPVFIYFLVTLTNLKSYAF